MSVAWFTRLYRLNEAGKFEAAIQEARGFVQKRPKDWAIRLQFAKALLSQGELAACAEQLDAALTHTRGRAAWPWFYKAALHARRGERQPMFAALSTAVRLDARLASEAAQSPFFAAFWKTKPFRDLIGSAPKPSTLGHRVVETAGAPARTRATPRSQKKPRSTPAKGLRKTRTRSAAARRSTKRTAPRRR